MRPSVRLGLCLVFGLCLCPALRTGALHAQSAVRAVRLSADLDTDDGSAIVRIEIDLVAEDTVGLRIELLGFGRGITAGFLAGGPGGPLVRFEERSGSRQWIVVERSAFESFGLERIAGESVARDGSGSGSPSAGDRGSPQDPDPGGGPYSFWRLRAAYVVHNARTARGESVHVHIPVLTVALPPVRDAGDVFHAGIHAPSNWLVTEAFPTGLRNSDDGVYTVDLAVAPSVVSLRARTDGAWRPGVPLLLDIAAGMILLAFVIIGLRWLRASGGTVATGGPPTGSVTSDDAGHGQRE